MANKTDVRVLKTKQKLRQAFTELIRDDGHIESVSISQICFSAGVNRNTFYAHYNDVISLYDDVKKSYYDCFMSEISKKKKDGENTQKTVTYLIRLLETNRILFSRLFSDEKGMEYLKSLVEYCLSDVMKNISVNTTLVTTRDFSLFITGGVTNLIVDWIKAGDTDVLPEQLGARISFFIYNIRTNYV